MKQQKMLEFFHHITQQNITPISNSSAKTVAELFKSSIEANLPELEIIKAWDVLLRRYVEEPGAIYFIRKYGGASNKQWHLLRRGFLTQFNNVGFIYCDNFLAHYFYNMAIEGYVTTYEDFRDTMLNLLFPYGHMGTNEEIGFQASPIGKQAKINSNGWKLAHIYSVNQKDYSFDYKSSEKLLFTIGEQKDWIKYDLRSLRKHDKDLNADEINTIKAHFLRLVHPINYFLVPKAKHHKSDVRNNIGENTDVLKFMKNIQLDRFGDIFTSYKKAISALDDIDSKTDVAQKEINIEISSLLIKTSGKKALKKINNVKNIKAISATESLSAIKIGELVKKTIAELIKDKSFKTKEIIALTDRVYSKQHFNINYPLFIKIRSEEKFTKLRLVNNHPRYWKNAVNINGEQYLVCKEWYEYNRKPFINWLKKRK